VLGYHFIMPRSKGNKKQNQKPESPPTPDRRKNRPLWFALSLLVLALGFFGYTIYERHREKFPETPPLEPVLLQQYENLAALLNNRDKLEQVDIAEMNMHAAEGLPGSESIDIEKYLQRLDQWALHVRSETERHMYRFQQNPEQYNNSVGHFCVSFLLQVLQEDCGVKYNMERVRNIDFRNSKDQFIHGMIDDENGGTCVSMPVLYVAVGRRLGYPLKLVLSKAHMLCRWDGPNETFNIEGAGSGFSAFPNERYYEKPVKMTEQDIKSGRYLRSLTPEEELACFLAARGHCQYDNNRRDEARTSYLVATRLAPKDPAYRSWYRGTLPKRKPVSLFDDLPSHRRQKNVPGFPQFVRPITPKQGFQPLQPPGRPPVTNAPKVP
jgi:hypothetical protein